MILAALVAGCGTDACAPIHTYEGEHRAVMARIINNNRDPVRVRFYCGGAVQRTVRFVAPFGASKHTVLVVQGQCDLRVTVDRVVDQAIEPRWDSRADLYGLEGCQVVDLKVWPTFDVSVTTQTLAGCDVE